VHRPAPRGRAASADPEQYDPGRRAALQGCEGSEVLVVGSQLAALLSIDAVAALERRYQQQDDTNQQAEIINYSG
jgi:hypothetical protein